MTSARNKTGFDEMRHRCPPWYNWEFHMILPLLTYSESMPSKKNSAVTRSTTTVSSGLSQGQTLNDARSTTITHPSPLPIQVTSPDETIDDALIEDSSAPALDNAIFVDQVNESYQQTPALQPTTSVAISIMGTTAASLTTLVLEPDATCESNDDIGTATPPQTPLIVWNKMPSNDPSCLGTGYFPFDRGTEDPPQYVVHDIELRGRVTTCNILAKPQYSHTLDVRRIASGKFGEFGEFGSIPQKFG
jgi:hypothetical protein